MTNWSTLCQQFLHILAQHAACYVLDPRNSMWGELLRSRLGNFKLVRKSIVSLDYGKHQVIMKLRLKGPRLVVLAHWCFVVAVDEFLGYL